MNPPGTNSRKSWSDPHIRSASKKANFSQDESKYFKIDEQSTSRVRGSEDYQYYDRGTNESADDAKVHQTSNDRNRKRIEGSTGKASYINWACKLQNYLNDQKDVHQTSFEGSYPSQNYTLQKHV